MRCVDSSVLVYQYVELVCKRPEFIVRLCFCNKAMLLQLAWSQDRFTGQWQLMGR